MNISEKSVWPYNACKLSGIFYFISFYDSFYFSGSRDKYEFSKNAEILKS